MSKFDEIAAEVTEIVRIVGKLRRAERDAQGEPALKFLPWGDMARMAIPPEGEPSEGDRPSQVYECALHFWAVRVAPQITEPQWQAMVDGAARANQDFPGDPIRFFENLFEDTVLLDGARILP